MARQFFDHNTKEGGLRIPHVAQTEMMQSDRRAWVCSWTKAMTLQDGGGNHLTDIFLSCLIDTTEHCYIITCDIPGAFMQTDIDELVCLSLEQEIADLWLKADPTYAEYATLEKDQTAIYAELNKALYGTFQAVF